MSTAEQLAFPGWCSPPEPQRCYGPCLALSLWQPWASLMAVREKQVETRSWPAPRAHLGRRIAIHAAKRRIPREEREWYLRHPDGEPFRRVLGWYYPSLDDLPLGAVVAVGTVVRCVRTEEIAPILAERERAFGDYTPGRWAWVFESIQRIEPPIPTSGMQGLWSWDGAAD